MGHYLPSPVSFAYFEDLTTKGLWTFRNLNDLRWAKGIVSIHSVFLKKNRGPVGLNCFVLGLRSPYSCLLLTSNIKHSYSQFISSISTEKWTWAIVKLCHNRMNRSWNQCSLNFVLMWTTVSIKIEKTIDKHFKVCFIAKSGIKITHVEF